jgi:hypothetical protein
VHSAYHKASFTIPLFFRLSFVVIWDVKVPCMPCGVVPLIVMIGGLAGRRCKRVLRVEILFIDVLEGLIDRCMEEDIDIVYSDCKEHMVKKK